jgi:hypothetical protein
MFAPAILGRVRTNLRMATCGTWLRCKWRPPCSGGGGKAAVPRGHGSFSPWVRRFRISSTAHDRHRPVTTLQCCSQLPLLVDRRRACSANDDSRPSARSRSHGNRNSFIASPGSAATLSRSGPHLAVTTATPQPIARGSQIPIGPARRTVVPIPARGFLPRGLSDACPRSALHCQLTGRHLITLNDSRP